MSWHNACVFGRRGSDLQIPTAWVQGDWVADGPDETVDLGDRPEVCALERHTFRLVSYASPGRDRAKRLFDVVMAATLCVVMLPLLIVIAGLK